MKLHPGNFIRETYCQHIVLEKLDIYREKVILDLYHILQIKINPKWVIDLHVKTKIIKLLE